MPQSQTWPGTVRIPGSAAALLELRLGESGHPALGFVVQVPHYLAESSYPDAAAALLDRLADEAGLSVPRAALLSAAEQTREAIAAQVAASEEVGQVVAALEEQYDAYMGARGRRSLLAAEETLPSADELAAEVERFLRARRPTPRRGLTSGSRGRGPAARGRRRPGRCTTRAGTGPDRTRRVRSATGRGEPRGDQQDVAVATTAQVLGLADECDVAEHRAARSPPRGASARVRGGRPRWPRRPRRAEHPGDLGRRTAWSSGGPASRRR